MSNSSKPILCLDGGDGARIPLDPLLWSGPGKFEDKHVPRSASFYEARHDNLIEWAAAGAFGATGSGVRTDGRVDDVDDPDAVRAAQAKRRDEAWRTPFASASSVAPQATALRVDSDDEPDPDAVRAAQAKRRDEAWRK